MPVPGPRDARGRTLGARNPDAERLDRFHSSPHLAIVDAGRTPGTMEATLRGCVLAAGQVRKFWRQSVNLLAPQSPFSWTSNSPAPGRPGFTAEGYQITRALRYMTRSFYVAGGTDDTRLSELHTVVLPNARHKPVTIAGGSVRSRPTVRNRLTSFGARVPPLNEHVQAARGDE